MEIRPLVPNWPVSSKVKAFVTNRFGGFSDNEYYSFNLASHVGDDLESVEKNRNLLVETLGLPEMPLWINQVHSPNVIEVPIQYEYFKVKEADLKVESSYQANSIVNAQEFVSGLECDAVYSKTPNSVCAVLTADCVPILLVNKKETEVAAVHAGWKGIINGVIQNSVLSFSTENQDAGDLLAWIGPCIGPQSFEVESDVLYQFAKIDQDLLVCFTPHQSKPNKWLGDLPAVCSIILQKLGLAKENIYHANIDTVIDNSYFSYRRDHVTGRFASIIWLEDK